jgi:hypothetical protein
MSRTRFLADFRIGFNSDVRMTGQDARMDAGGIDCGIADRVAAVVPWRRRADRRAVAGQADVALERFRADRKRSARSGSLFERATLSG